MRVVSLHRLVSPIISRGCQITARLNGGNLLKFAGPHGGWTEQLAGIWTSSAAAKRQTFAPLRPSRGSLLASLCVPDWVAYLLRQERKLYLVRLAARISRPRKTPIRSCPWPRASRRRAATPDAQPKL